MSLSDYLLIELEQMAERPTLEEMRARLAARTPTVVETPAAQMVRDERDA